VRIVRHVQFAARPKNETRPYAGHENRPIVHRALNAAVDLREQWRFDHGSRESHPFYKTLK
jgi:hypothetical protein